jgi:hypothetical protein
MYKAMHLSPMIPSYDVRATRLFFEELFGFTDVRDEGSYVIMQKDNCMIHILNAGDIGEMEFYLEVQGIDELWNNIKDKLTGIKTKVPFDQEYGMREFHIIIPHTKTLMFVGQGINS